MAMEVERATQLVADAQLREADVLPQETDAQLRGAGDVEVRREHVRAPLILRLLSLVLTAVVSIVLTACVCLAVAQRLGYQPYAIVSGSMTPEIPVGALVFADENEPYGSSLVGHVIAFRSAGGPVVVHRAIEMGEEGLITQGDANDAPDGGAVGAGNYIGSVRWFIPWAGFAFVQLGTMEGVVAIALLTLASLIMRWAVRRWDRTITTTTQRVAVPAQ